MSKTTELLDLYKAAKGIETDTEAARSLRITKQAVSNYRTQGHGAAPAVIQRLCDGSGENVAHWLPLIQAEREKDTADRRVWLQLAATAASIAVALLTRMSIYVKWTRPVALSKLALTRV